MRTVLLGGTFDPPHLGHLVLAECARVQLNADRVLFIPAGEPWRKADRDVSPSHERLAMTHLAVRDHLAFEVDNREVRRPGPTYTVDTLEALHADRAGDLVLILGSDGLADMPNWHEYRRIGELATIIVALKDIGADQVPQLAEAVGLSSVPEVVDMPRLPISSTLLRARVFHGKTIRYLVPHAVESYIRTKGLYLPPPGADSASD